MYKTLFKKSTFYASSAGKKPTGSRSAHAADQGKIKKKVDFFLALTFLIFIGSWLFLLIGLLIKGSSGGSVFFRQLRHGKNNRPFYCLKFRTMVENDKADMVQARKGDARITRIGAFLRKSSLDELPQLLNVLKGEMALVGPRPHAVPMNEVFADRIPGYMQRHAIRPGLTGLAQSKGYRGEIQNYQDLYGRYRLDMFYQKKMNWLFDLKIICWTAYAMLFDNGKAY